MRPRSAVTPQTQRICVSCRLAAGDACGRGGEAGARRPFTGGYLRARVCCINTGMGQSGLARLGRTMQLEPRTQYTGWKHPPYIAKQQVAVSRPRV